MYAGYRAAAAHRAPRDLADRLADGLAPRTRRNLTAPAVAELWRSLRAERRKITTASGAEREMRRALSDSSRWVLVYDNRVYVSANFYRHTKHSSHANMVHEAAALVGLPNALYALSVGTSGASGCNGLPVSLAINKQMGYRQCGVLIPNTYFEGSPTKWAQENEAVSHDVIPFAARRPVAFYRGGLRSTPRNGSWDTREACAAYASARVEIKTSAPAPPDTG